jgi:hypothetical protein
MSSVILAVTDATSFAGARVYRKVVARQHGDERLCPSTAMAAPARFHQQARRGGWCAGFNDRLFASEQPGRTRPVTEISPAQFPFANPQAASRAQHFYHVRAS